MSAQLLKHGRADRGDEEERDRGRAQKPAELREMKFAAEVARDARYEPRVEEREVRVEAAVEGEAIPSTPGKMTGA